MGGFLFFGENMGSISHVLPSFSVGSMFYWIELTAICTSMYGDLWILVFKCSQFLCVYANIRIFGVVMFSTFFYLEPLDKI